MNKRIPLLLAAAGLAAAATAAAEPGFAVKQVMVPGMGAGVLAAEKSASTSTIGARAISTNSQTVYGGFEVATTALVYILVRGNSLGTLGVTQNYLDLPRVRIYTASGADIYNQAGYQGFNGCSAGAATDAPVVNYYAARGIPVSQFDACIADVFPPGAYTFTVTPSVAGQTSTQTSLRTGEVLFEVKLGP